MVRRAMRRSLLVLALAASAAPATAAAAPASSVSQHGVTWTFDAEYESGQFANGDYWVVGPVVVTAITPDYDGSHHGWQSNPAAGSEQGFDVRISDFEASLVPELPYTAQPGESLVKSISSEPLDDDSCLPCLETAAVLTVLAEVPVDEGATLFRPPYTSGGKTFYSTNDLHPELLPELEPVSGTPSPADVAALFARVQMDHKMGWTGRVMHPAQNLPDYGSDIASRNGAGALRLMLNDAVGDKMELLISYVQMGIDLYGILLSGGSWTGDGGHAEGRKLPIAFAGVLLDDQEMKDAVLDAGRETFGENGGVELHENAGIPLFAQVECGEETYWRKLADPEASGSTTCKDPYGYIDGGAYPGEGYLFCCLAQNWKYTSFAVRLMPEIRVVWNDEDFHEFVDRYADVGGWTQPDPCAPPDGVCAGGTNEGAPCTLASGPDICTGEGACDTTVNWPQSYGVTYGSDGNGGCILDTDSSDGIGRIPGNHGINPDTGYHGDAFADEVWAAHRDKIPPVCSINDECQDGRICCDGGCVHAVCASDEQCDDRNDETVDVCLNPGTCDAECRNTLTDAGKGEDNGCSCGVARGLDALPSLLCLLLLGLLLRRVRRRV